MHECLYFSAPAGGGQRQTREDLINVGWRTGAATKTVAANAAHLAHLLAGSPYPPS